MFRKLNFFFRNLAERSGTSHPDIAISVESAHERTPFNWSVIWQSSEFNRSISARVLLLFFESWQQHTHSHPADVSNEMHFSLRMKIMLSLCDCNHMSSTNTPGAEPIWSQRRHDVAVLKGWSLSQPATCTAFLPVNRFGVQSSGGTSVWGVSGGQAAVEEINMWWLRGRRGPSYLRTVKPSSNLLRKKIAELNLRPNPWN